MTLVGLIYGLSKLLNGMLADRMNARWHMTLGLLGCVVLNFIFGWGASISTMITGTTDGASFVNTMVILFAVLLVLNNIFQGAGFTSLLKNAVIDAEQNNKATVFGYWVSDPERYGVAEFDKNGNCISIEEKPKEPKSNYAVVGLYFYPNKVVDVAKNIKPSARGELEITSVNQAFLNDGELKVQVFDRGFAWLDTGTHDSLSEASTYIEVLEKRTGLKVACLEEIAYTQGWITKEKIIELAQPMIKNQYGQYLLRVAEL